MIQRQVELLAPAGSYESMMAAVAAGADAVYIGGSRFGARAYADNPEEDRLLEAIDYVHLHGRKLYLTVNTLMKDEELASLYDYIAPYYRQGLDGVIVQDMGAFACIRERFPDLPVHASTQMTITGVHGARILKELGAERIVTARELSLDEIEAIHREVDIEIESFVHGALCYCYSGQCLFSSLIGGRSGNRGRCAQTCRLPFDVKKDGKQLNGRDSRYVLSLKDLCTLDLIPHMIEAGIYSMKIEGRMKSPRYTAGVVSIYRKYVDLYLKSGREGYRVEDGDRKRLLDLFDRGGQSDGYYRRHNGKDMVVWKEKPQFREGNEDLFRYLDEMYVEKELKEGIKGLAVVKQGEPSRLTLCMGDRKVTVEGSIVEEARNQPMDEERIRKQLQKTGNTPFRFDSLKVEVSGSVFIPLQALNELRRLGLEALLEELLKGYRRQELHAWKGNSKTAAQTTAYDLGGIQQNVSAQNRSEFHSTPLESLMDIPMAVSIERPDCFDTVLTAPDIDRIYLDAAEFIPSSWRSLADRCHQAGKACMLALPHIFRPEAEVFFRRHGECLLQAGFDGVLVRNLEEVDFMRQMKADLLMVFDYGMYGMNGRAQIMMTELGASELTWPVESNSRELERLPLPGELIVYGRLPMMVTAQCIHQGTEGCDKKPGTLWLKDRMGKEFPVKNRCIFCYNTIYNAAPVSLLNMTDIIKRTGPSRLRLQLTTETPGEAKDILHCFGDNIRRNMEAVLPFKEYTRGHFKRGVE